MFNARFYNELKKNQKKKRKWIKLCKQNDKIKCVYLSFISTSKYIFQSQSKTTRNLFSLSVHSEKSQIGDYKNN